MPSPTKGVPVELDKTRHLRYPLGSMREMSDDADLVTVLHIGLRHEDEELTVEEVGQMIDLESLPELAAPLRKATGGLVDIDKLLYSRNGGQPEGGAEGNVTEPPADG